MREQTSLGSRKVYTKPKYDQTQIGRIVSTANYKIYGRVEVAFLDYSKPLPVWVIGDIDRAPVEGDLVLVGFIQGREDAPYLAGFVRNECYTANFIKVEKDRITIQMPTTAADVNGRLLDDSKKSSRMRIEVTTSGVFINGATAAVIGNAVAVSVPGIGTCTGTITG